MARECVQDLQEWLDLLIPPWLHTLLKMGSITTMVVRLLRLIYAWSRRQADKQGERAPNHRIHFDYTYIEGLLRELDDEIEQWKKQEKSEVEILGLSLLRVLSICWAVIQIVWERLFTKQQPRP